MIGASPDIVIVGAGGAGIPLAVRIAEAGTQVLLVESGQVPATPSGLPESIRTAGTLQGADPENAHTRTFHTVLRDQRHYGIVRGKFAGGSTATNGGYFVRARPADFERWSRVAGDEWSRDACLPALRRMENDRQFGRDPDHGAEGPMLITRHDLSDPISHDILGAASRLAIPFESDKNADSPAGIGPVPQNRRGDVRWSTAWGYLWSRTSPVTLTIAEGTTARRIVFAGDRVVGVELDSPAGACVVSCAEVILCAGAFASPQLLLLSGIGPHADLGRLGIRCVTDLPGVGSAFDDHPSIDVDFGVRADAVDLSGWTLSVGINTMVAHGEVELLPLLKPVDYLLSARTPKRTESVTLPLRVSVSRPYGRGRLALASTDPHASPAIEHRYLSDGRDLLALVDGVRLAGSLLSEMKADGRVVSVPGGLMECADEQVARWIRATIGTSVHTCATAPMGPATSDDAVVDAHGRVYGVTGLRVADTSILPDTPSRGPANTAVLIGERIAELLLAE